MTESIKNNVLKYEEKIVFSLRQLYSQYGYLPFRMSKFEEYDLYMKNKEFLVSDRVISFNDTNGKLLALKPDVTLSIIKSGEDEKGCKQKVYYNENVYRVSGSTHRYKEIMQAGLECIGDLDFYDIFEVIDLARQSLDKISEKNVLEISNLSVLSQILDSICTDKKFQEQALSFISEKNSHDLQRLCEEYEISKKNTERICLLTEIHTELKNVISLLEENFTVDISELKALNEIYPELIFDFSIVSDTNYYNGFVFKGYIDGVYESVLSGGQYDKMMQKLHCKSGAIGFAIYLDALEDLDKTNSKYDVDILLLYDESISPISIKSQIVENNALGKTVSAQKAIPEKLRYKELIDLRKGDK